MFGLWLGRWETSGAVAESQTSPPSAGAASSPWPKASPKPRKKGGQGPEALCASQRQACGWTQRLQCPTANTRESKCPLTFGCNMPAANCSRMLFAYEVGAARCCIWSNVKRGGARKKQLDAPVCALRILHGGFYRAKFTSLLQWNCLCTHYASFSSVFFFFWLLARTPSRSARNAGRTFSNGWRSLPVPQHKIPRPREKKEKNHVEGFPVVYFLFPRVFCPLVSVDVLCFPEDPPNGLGSWGCGGLCCWWVQSSLSIKESPPARFK